MAVDVQGLDLLEVHHDIEAAFERCGTASMQHVR